MKKRAITIVLTAAMVASLATGCGGATGESNNTSTTIQTESMLQTESESTEVSETVQSGDTRTVTDSDGNEVEIPAEVTKAAPTIGAFAQVTEMLTDGEGKISAAATQQISDAFKQVFTDYTESNPENYDSSSVEDLIASGTQVVYGPKAMFTDEQLAQLKAAGVAFVSVNNLSDSQSMMESFRLIGEILGDKEKERADAFCDEYQASIDDCKERTKALSEDEKVKVLRLSTNGGTYSTVNKSDIFNSITEEAGGINVAADYEVAEQSGGQKSGPNAGLTVDAEQILSWNPDAIITLSQDSVDEILSDPALSEVSAVKNGKVYNTPQGLYMWGVRSGENIMMTPWLGQILYPDLFEDVDMKTVVKDFYEKWYHTELDDAGAEAVLAGR